MKLSFAWTAGRVFMLRNLAPNYTPTEIADRLNCSDADVCRKLEELNITHPPRPIPKTEPAKILPEGSRANPQKYVKLAPVTFPMFEDHPDADKDRYRGRKPQPQSVQSQIGCSALMCVGG